MSLNNLIDESKFLIWKIFFDSSGDLIEHFVSIDLRTSVQISRTHKKFRIAENENIHYSESKDLA